MKKTTKAQAINAMCKWCIYDPKEKGSWKQQVTICQDSKCPLHPHRPIAISLPLELLKKYNMTYDDLDTRAKSAYK